MTERLDTAAIRDAYRRGRDLDGPTFLALCDALDAARTERDGSKIREQMRLADWREQRDRAEAAEAELAVVKDFKEYMLTHDPGPFVTELEERLEAAEARTERLAETITFERARLRTAHCSELLAAEARIAAALNIEPVMGKNLTPRDEFAWGYNTALGDFHRALTEAPNE